MKKLEGLFEKVEEPVQSVKPVVLTPEQPEQPELPEIKLEDAIQESKNVKKVEPEETNQKEIWT